MVSLVGVLACEDPAVEALGLRRSWGRRQPLRDIRVIVPGLVGAWGVARRGGEVIWRFAVV